MVSVKVTVTYFKISGKYYTDATFNVSDACVINDGSCLSMDRVVDEYKAMQRASNIPGLHGDGKDYYKVFTADDGYPVLIKPEV